MNLDPKDAEESFSTASASQPDRIVVSFSHSDYLSSAAGVEKVIGMEQKCYNDHGIAYFHIYPLPAGTVSNDRGHIGVGLNVDGQPTGQYSAKQLGDLLQQFCRQTAVEFVALHVHHLAHLPIAIILYFIDTIKPRCVRFFVHDYYSLCPQANLLYNGEMFCELPAVDSVKCATCFAGRGRRQHLKSLEAFFAHVSQFVASSEIARELFLKVYPDFHEKTIVIPRQQIRFNTANLSMPRQTELLHKIRVAYIGQPYYHKGWATWEKLVSSFDLDQYELYHAGTAKKHSPNVQYLPVSFLTGDEDCMTHALRNHQINVAFLWSVCPETYSFTFFESLAAGCFVVTNPNSGNIAEKVRQYSCGVIFPDEKNLFAYFADVERVKRDLAQYALRVSRVDLKPTSLPEEDLIDRHTSRRVISTEGGSNFMECKNVYKLNMSDTLSNTQNFQSRWKRIIKSKGIQCAKWWRDFLLPHRTTRRMVVLMTLAVVANPRQFWHAVFCTKSDL